MKVAVVTGAGGALGTLVALNLSKKKYFLALASRSNHKLDKLCQEIKRKKGHVLGVPLDIGSPGEVERFINKIMKRKGRIDAVINCFGYVHGPNTLQQTTYTDLQRCLEVNVQGAFSVLKKVIPIMKRQREGVIINVASKAGRMPVPRLAAYSASKAALIALTQAASKELMNTGILCVTVSPSGMNTPMREFVYGRDDAVKQQDPQIVADIITKMVERKILVPQGSDVLVVGGRVMVREPELI